MKTVTTGTLAESAAPKCLATLPPTARKLKLKCKWNKTDEN
jgi:hypothetical protein